jgi:Predicted O-methyltransferase
MNYIEYYERSLELLSKNGLIIIDNVLWYGEVVNENNTDKFTKNIKEFNDHISKDKRIEKLIIPLGDGMTVCRKI